MTGQTAASQGADHANAVAGGESPAETGSEALRDSYANGYAHSSARFQADTAKHTMEIARHDGLYRHLRFRNPASSIYWFDLITWPGHLSITGDMGSYTFARTRDMFEFFGLTGEGINPSYWGEKLVADSGYKEFSDSMFREHVAEAIENHVAGLSPDTRAAFLATLQDEVLSYDQDYGKHEQPARDAVDGFYHSGFRFAEAWEWDLRDYTGHFLWCCHAIRAGIAQFQAAQP